MKYNLIVVGSGPGGYVAAIRASQLGLKTAIIERESLGGICLNWGCIPTKALIKSAEVFNYLGHAKDYGITVKEASADLAAVVKRSRDVADGMSKGVQFLMKKNKIDVINGTGKLARGKKVEVTDDKGAVTTYEADNIIIATGARAKALPNIPIDGEKVIDYRKAMVPQKQPKSLVVIGAGAIGCEFAYFYHAMGTKVTVIEFLEQGLVPREDPEVSKELKRQFTRSGIDVMVNTAVEKVDISGKQINVIAKDRKTGNVTEIQCDLVLSAAGVTSNIENIGLETLGIKTEKDKVVVNQWYETNVAGVYAIGDITEGPALAHVASAEAIICVEKIAGHHPQPLDYGNIPSCTYCQPEVASVGMTEEQAKAAGFELKIGKFPFSASGKAKAAGHPEGFVKLIVDAKYGEILGAHMIGHGVTDMIAEIVLARRLEATGMDLVKTVHPHPTMSEAVMEAAAAAYGEVIHL
ncbi:MAG: dihydrolipoyl dehydrogenase [Saprospiraceae bacterium]|nr:dihydrolipoyl dehydrogenase [Candidatus Opimibacter skivensis]MBP6681054.1 dihydrolipoyl dehydrogenase [Saprospiraceae bacterium]MBP8086118.1 dihydrolipoyl dehydrogenase [Saprospiraceae bacterium]